MLCYLHSQGQIALLIEPNQINCIWWERDQKLADSDFSYVGFKHLIAVDSKSEN